MDNSMEEYYKVLQYLNETHVDRQYGLEFKNISELKTNLNHYLTHEHYSDFYNSFAIDNIQNGDCIQVIMDDARDLKNVDTLEIMFYSETNIQPSSLKIGLSNIKTGIVENMVIDSNHLIPEESVTDKPFKLFKYRIRKTTTKMQKKNRKVSSVQTINLHFTTDVPKLFLSNVVFRIENYSLTLENLDDHILAGRDYITNQILLDDFDKIPQPLKHLSYKAAAAYAWLTHWENQGKVMDDGSKEGRNYATRLFDQIDRFIQKFLDANPDYRIIDTQKQINTDLIGFTSYKDYPLEKDWRRYR